MLLKYNVVIALLIVVAPYCCLCFFSGYKRVNIEYSSRLQLLNRNRIARSNDGPASTNDIRTTSTSKKQNIVVDGTVSIRGIRDSAISSTSTNKKENIVVAGDSRLPATYKLGLFCFYVYVHVYLYEFIDRYVYIKT
jgi:hypothetical protein